MKDIALRRASRYLERQRRPQRFLLASSVSSTSSMLYLPLTYQWAIADPDHPESALNSIPKAVLQRARGVSLMGL